MASINIQQNNLSKQTKLQLFPRERPLQKSMLSAQIQNHHNTPTSRNNPIEFSSFTPLKKSLYTPTEATSTPNTINFALGSIPPPTFQSRISTLSEPVHQSYTLKSLLSPFKNDPKSEQSPQDNPRLISKHQKRFFQIGENRIQPSQIDTLCYEVITQIKEKHLPELLGQLKKQFFDNINNLRQQFHSLRDEMRSSTRKQDSSNGINPSQILNSFGKLKIEQELSELQTQYFLLQGRLNQFEGKLSQTSKVIVNELERFNNRFEVQSKTNSLKAGILRSTLPPIMLEYRESIVVRKTEQQREKQKEISLGKRIYYIDQLGYLMDSQGRYLLDRQGVQVRLQDRHIRLLQAENIFQR